MISRVQVEAAVFVFEQHHGRQLDAFERSCVNGAGLTCVAIDELADDVWRFADESTDPDARSAAYFALGKLARQSDKQKFIDVLRVELRRDFQAMYQVMIALDNLGEPVFSRSGVGSIESSLNQQDALTYLSRQKPKCA